MVRIWAKDYKIRKTKYVQALHSHFILIEREYIGDSNEKSGLYYIEIDFDECETYGSNGSNDPKGGKLSDFIAAHADKDLKPVFEYSKPVGLGLWDAKGTPMTLAISYVTYPDSNSTRIKLVALTSPSGTLAICDDLELKDNPSVDCIELISPPNSQTRVYSLYCTSSGLDGGYH